MPVSHELLRDRGPQPSLQTFMQNASLLPECSAIQRFMQTSRSQCGVGLTPLHMVVLSHNATVQELMCLQRKTALHMASTLQGRLAQVDAVRLLMRRGADPSTKNLENEQPAQLVLEGPLGEQLRDASGLASYQYWTRLEERS
ncbi:unnamed protein product [Leuciscus chuanchicus]